MINGRRFNRNFSTAKWNSPEEAAAAAIKFCKETLGAHPSEQSSGAVQPSIPSRFIAQYEPLHHEAITHGIDPIDAFRYGVRLRLKERAAQLTVSHARQHFFIALGRKGFKEGYLRDLAGFYDSFEQEFGGVKMDDIIREDIEKWLTRRLSQKGAKSPLTWNDWRRKLLQLWEFALLPENAWVTQNIVEQIPQK